MDAGAGEGIEVGASPVDKELVHVEGGGGFGLEEESKDVHV